MNKHIEMWEWSLGNKAILYRDLKEHFDQYGSFGNPDIDNRYWCKFMEALNTKAHFTLKYKGKEYVAFNALGRTYPLDEYVKQPHAEIYIKPEEADK